MGDATWTFMTNHFHVLYCLSEDPDMRLRDIAQQVGITERAAHRIIAELESNDYITIEKDGRRNHYAIHEEKHLRHPLEESCTIRDVLALVRNRSKRKGRA